ncbi:MAG: hypothetical protein R3E94_07955 [Burkholderiaceae bacterium]
MKPSPARLLRLTGVVVLGVAWAVAAHLTSASGEASGWGAALALCPLLLALGVALWRLPHRGLAAAVALASVGMLAWLWPLLRSQVALLYFVQQVGIYLMLAVVFGRTLGGPGEPLVTQMARRLHGGELSQRQVTYTRGVTVAWTGFFLVMVAASSTLFLLASPATWSFFANLLGGPLMGLMFVAEYLVRCRRLPPAERASLADAVRAWRQHQSDSAS